MFAFWSSVALMSGRYHGTPMAKHMPLPVDADHFDRWLALFEATAREVCTPEAATHFVELARRIAASLELGIAGSQGVLLGNGERFRRASRQEISDETSQHRSQPRIVNDTALAQEPANPFAGSSLVPMLISGIVLVLVGMIAARDVELTAEDRPPRGRERSAAASFQSAATAAQAVTAPPLLRRPIYCSSANTPVAIACTATKA